MNFIKKIINFLKVWLPFGFKKTAKAINQIDKFDGAIKCSACGKKI